MATSYDVNLGIRSVLSFKRPSKSIEAPRPIMQTVRTLEGEEFADLGMTEQTRVLIVDPIAPYTIRYETTSSEQTVVMRNFGNSTITVQTILCSNEGVDAVYNYPAEGPGYVVKIEPESSSTFGLSFYGRQLGTWTNQLLVVSNTDVIYYKVPTEQTVSNIYDFDIVPPLATGTVSTYARGFTQAFSIIPYQGVTTSITAYTTGSAGFSIVSLSTTSMRVNFDPNAVGNTLGSYTATIVVTGNSVTHQATLTSVISFEESDYQNYGTWISPVSYFNSVVGISYDKIAGRRTLTIGVGTGGEGIEEYARGGALFADLNGLGISGAELDPQYPYWANVYRIPLNEDGDTTPRVYQSKDHLVKNYNDLEYGSYFGDYLSAGSMFIVHDDGRGNLRVEMNRLRELTEDEDLNKTLSNLSRAFYYYSDVDDPSRYPDNNTGNLEMMAMDPGLEYTVDGIITKLFLGFLRNGSIVTSFVDKPSNS